MSLKDSLQRLEEKRQRYKIQAQNICSEKIDSGDYKKRSVAVNPIAFEEDVTCGCQACGAPYDRKGVMIVDSIGPVCFNCLYTLTEFVLS